METIMNVIGNGMKDAKVIAVDKALEYVLQHESFSSLSMGEEQVQTLKAILDEYKASIPLPKGTPKAPKAPKEPKEPKAPKEKKEKAKAEPKQEVTEASADDNKPKRPPTAQALFVKEKKAALKAENPSMSAKDLQQQALAAWATHKESLPKVDKPKAEPKPKAEKPKKEAKPKAEPKAKKAKPTVAVVEDSDDEPVVFSTVKAGGAVMEDSDEEAF